MSEAMLRRSRVAWFLGGALLVIGSLVMIGQSLIAITNGDLASTTRVRGGDVPTWGLGLVGLAIPPIMWWLWRRDAGATVKREGLVNIQPVQGGLYLVGNHGAATGITVPVQDRSALRITLVKTRSSTVGLISFYGLRLTSTHGTVLMDLQLMPKALDLSPLMAELARRRISVELDPALENRHDHGKAPHVPPPSGPVSPTYQSAPPTAGWNPQ